MRSWLFVPCAKAKALQKARDLDCDALIFDLEDGVGDAQRAGAVTALAEAWHGGFRAGLRLVRVHPPSLNSIRRALHGCAVDGIVVPKVNGADDLRAVAAAWPGVPLWAMIETAKGVVNLANICATGPELRGLIAGPNDLRRDLRGRPLQGRAEIAAALAQIVLHGRANGLAVVDGVYNQYTDEQGFIAECQQGRSLGFDGKTLIHPAQIAPANSAFAPSDEERAWARTVIAAFAGSEAGVISLGGEMVERLHLDMAQRILSSSG